MAAVAHVVQTGLDFGGLALGITGPDITPVSELPSFNGGIEIKDAPLDAMLSVSITGDTDHFSVRDIYIMEFFTERWHGDDNGEGPPPGHGGGHPGPPPTIKVLEVVNFSDGTQPIDVKQGQFVLVRIVYNSGSIAGRFSGTVIIQGDTWETIKIPLSLFIADITTTFSITPLCIQQGQEISVETSVQSVAGPDVDISYEMSPLQLDTGITLAPISFHLGQTETKQVNFIFTAAPEAPLGINTLFVDQVAFRRKGLLLPVNIIPASTPGPVNNGGDPTCFFADPPGSIGVAPNAYGLKDGLPRKSQLAYSFNSQLPTPPPPPPGTPAQPFFAGVIAQAFQIWSAAAPSINATNSSTNVDIAILPGNLNASPTGTIRGSTKPDGSQIQFDNANTLWRPNIASFQPGDPPNTFSLLAIAIHEIGHALGLLHSTNPASVMFPSGNLEALNPEDIAAIKALYGWAPQSLVPGIGTETGPAICGCGSTLVLVWRGIGDDHNIWYATSSNGKDWSAQQTIPGAATSHSPTIAWDGTLLWLAWKGVPGDQGLYFATWDLTNPWGNVIPINGVGSSNGPCISIVGSPILAWKGVEGDAGIYYSQFSNTGGWAGQKNIGGVGTSDSPAIATDPVTGVPRMVWKGEDGDDTLYTSTLRTIAGVPIWQPQEDVAWVILGNGSAGMITVGRPGSSFGTGMVTAGGRILMAWRGVNDDQDIYFTQAAPDSGISGQTLAEWSTQAKVGSIATSARPSIASFNGNTFLTWKGVEGDHNIYTTFM